VDSPQDRYASQLKKWGPSANLGIRVDAEDYELYQNKPYYVRKFIRETLRAVFKRAVRGETAEDIVESIQKPIEIKLSVEHKHLASDMLKLSKRLEEYEERLEQEITQRLSCEEDKKKLLEQLNQLSHKKEEEEAKSIQIKKLENELAKAKEAISELMNLLDVATACVEDTEIKNVFLNRLNKVANQYGAPKTTQIIEKLKSKCSKTK